MGSRAVLTYMPPGTIVLETFKYKVTTGFPLQTPSASLDPCPFLSGAYGGEDTFQP